MPENDQMDDIINQPTFSDMLSDLSRELVRHTEARKLMTTKNLCKSYSGFIGFSFQHVESINSLPTDVDDIVNGLRKIQSDIYHIEAKYSRVVHKLRCKYEELYRSLIIKRSVILHNSPTAAKNDQTELQKSEICTEQDIGLGYNEYKSFITEDSTFNNLVLASKR